MTTAIPSANKSVEFQQQPADKRSSARFPLHATVVLSLPGEERRCLFTKNVSAGGMFVLSDQPAPPEGTKVGVELIVNDHFKFRSSGVVAHTRATTSLNGNTRSTADSAASSRSRASSGCTGRAGPLARCTDSSSLTATITHHGLELRLAHRVLRLGVGVHARGQGG